MPFSTAFQENYFIERVLQGRRNPIAAFGIAVAAAGIATLLRWAVGEQVGEGLPFLTYYPAIIVATVAGGFWPGILATVLSSATAFSLFLPSFSGPELNQRELVALALFVFIACINVFIVAMLDVAVKRSVAQVEQVRVLIESVPTGIVLVDDAGVIKLVNSSTEKLFGYNRQNLVGKNIELLVPLPQVAEHRKARDAFLQKPEARAMGAGRDLAGRRRDGTEFPVEIGLNPVSRNGQTVVLATVIDISDRKKAQGTEKLVIRELKHRTQNLFAVFQAIAARSVDENKTAADIKSALNGRVNALAQAYALTADAGWDGASLAAILEQELAAFSDRVNFVGCDIIVSPSAAQQFSLIIHELATNALKYGALSTADGRVSIEGKIEGLDGGKMFSFAWVETGGPLVTKPTRKGFGSVILLDSAKHFGQSVVLDYVPRGLRYELEVQLKAIEASNKRPSSATVSETGTSLV